ncbi:cation diffusion facilitator family transporter [Bacteroidota bacterium]
MKNGTYKNNNSSNAVIKSEKGRKSTIIGIFTNLFLALIKGFAGYFGNSYALIADSIESTADVFSSGIIWGGLKLASKPPDKNHPYGHGKAEPLVAALISLILISAALLIFIQSIGEILTSHSAPAPFTLYVLVLVVIIKEILFRYIIKVGETIESTAVKVDAWHHRSDALTSLAAFIGISIALVGGEGYETADDWAAAFAAFIIFYNAYRLLKPAVKELMDTSPNPQTERRVKEIAANVEGVKDLDKCKIRKMGFEFYVDLDIRVDGNITVIEGHEIAHQVKEQILNSDLNVANILIHVEPFPK